MRPGRELRRISDVLRAFARAPELQRHDRWTAAELLGYQQRQLERLVVHAVRHSPFYRALYRHVRLEAPLRLATLPSVDKQTFMENFDEIVTDRRLRLADLRAHITTMESCRDYYLGEFVVAPTAGSSGRAGILVANRREWVSSLAHRIRVARFTGLRIVTGLRRLKATCILSPTPYHMSYIVPRTLDLGFFKTQMLSVTSRTDELVSALNAFQPNILISYPSALALLAVEQLEGRLRINPGWLAVGSEPLWEEMARRIFDAWAVVPFNVYGATEAGGPIGADCSLHRGIHIFADRVMVEIVDEHHQPVRAGVPGQKVFVTNLVNYTQPLIRFEMSDILTAGQEPCPCGRAFPLVQSVEGRNDEILYMRDVRGMEVAVHPVSIRGLMAGLPDVNQYWLVHDLDGLHLDLVLRRNAPPRHAELGIREKLAGTLAALGAVCPPLHVRYVERLERPSGAAKLRSIRSNVPRYPPMHEGSP